MPASVFNFWHGKEDAKFPQAIILRNTPDVFNPVHTGVPSTV